MSAEFAKMLKETLEKMQERINLAQWDNDNDPQMLKKMKEMSNVWMIGSPFNRPSLTFSLFHVNLVNDPISFSGISDLWTGINTTMN